MRLRAVVIRRAVVKRPLSRAAMHTRTHRTHPELPRRSAASGLLTNEGLERTEGSKGLKDRPSRFSFALPPRAPPGRRSREFYGRRSADRPCHRPPHELRIKCAAYRGFLEGVRLARPGGYCYAARRPPRSVPTGPHGLGARRWRSDGNRKLRGVAQLG